MLVACYNIQDDGTNISSVSKTILDIGTGISIVNTLIWDGSKNVVYGGTNMLDVGTNSKMTIPSIQMPIPTL